jgi:hypothetical protein
VSLAIPSLQLRLTTSLFSNLDSKLKTNSRYLSIDQCSVLVLICSHILLRSCLVQMIELKTFISIHNNDIKMISQTHFTEKSCLKVPSSTVYHSNHPVEIAKSWYCYNGRLPYNKKCHQESILKPIWTCGIQLWLLLPTQKS